MYRIYEVRNGDTLAGIAARLGVSPEVLATLNGINISTVLTPNSYIVIPNNDGNMFDTYAVQKGDTMYEIAGKYNLDPSQLLQLNGLNQNDIIYPNQEILIPKSNTGFYVTNEGDTINSITRALRIPIESIARQNDTIYLVPDQLIVYKK